MDKPIRICKECEKLLAEAFKVEHVGQLATVGKCEQCESTALLHNVRIKKKAKT